MLNTQQAGPGNPTAPNVHETSTRVHTCPACGYHEGEPVWKARKGQHFWIQQCRGCDLVYTIPSLKFEQMIQHYDATYYGRDNRRFIVFGEWLISLLRRRRSDKIQRLRQPGRVLDVGCG